MNRIKPKYRVGSKTKSGKFMVLAYIDARDVENELDSMFDKNWSCDHKIIKDDERGVVVECRITANGQTRSDIGFHAYEKYENNDNYDNLHKSAYNDAFKRAGVKRGIGRYLYDAPAMYITEEEEKQNKFNFNNFIKRRFQKKLTERFNSYSNQQG